MKKHLKVIITVLVFNCAVKAQVVNTIAGNGTQGYAGNGGNANIAQLNSPQGLVVDRYGNLYFADQNNHCIRKVNTSGIISNYAGTNIPGFSGDGNLAINAQLNKPQGIAIDTADNIYIADKGNYRIRKIDTLGIITTIAGDGSNNWSYGNGNALSSKIVPVDLKVDKGGNIFVVDSSRICKIKPNGIKYIIAGLGIGGLTLDRPQGIAIDEIGNIYISDTYYYRVIKIDSIGNFTFEINSSGNFSGSICTNCPSGTAFINTPRGLISDKYGNLYTIEAGSPGWIRMVDLNDTIRVLTITSSPTFQAGYLALDKYGNIYFSEPDFHHIKKITNCFTPTPKICKVEVDSMSENNIITWDKGLYNNADTFYIYRDTANYSYGLIAKVSANEISMFVDTVRHLYTANGDPNISSWKYKLAYRNICGDTSELSPYHETIYQYHQGEQFIWNHYKIEGQTTPIQGLFNYQLLRKNQGANDVWNIIATTDTTSAIDPEYGTFQNSASWRIRTAWTMGCNPIQSIVTPSISNTHLGDNASEVSSINGENLYSVYPSPFQESIKIMSNQELYDDAAVTIYNALGCLLFECPILKPVTSINTSAFNSGIYILAIRSKQKINYWKLFKDYN